jgi:cob(I)alamin adenosyltransferase
MDKGYIHIYTGDGKGKTTAAFGLALRAAGAGRRVFIGQFIKDMDYHEVVLIRERIPEITVELFGTGAGCLIERQGGEEDIRCARAGLDRIKEVLLSGEYGMVILDEVTVAMALGLLSEEAIAEVMALRPDPIELVLTGRRATQRLMDMADLVTDCKEIKHYYATQGLLARDGIER